MSMIQISNLTFSYEGSYDTIFDQVSFQIDTDWKLGFTGRNGRGKTTFLSLLMGCYEYSGTISSSVSFDYFPYEITGKDRNTLEIAETVRPGFELWKLCRELNLLEVDAEVLYRPFSSLSNGEQTKVLLALLFSEENHFLLIDEPTNHLDMEGRKLVSRYLNSKKGFILVSHDQWFLDSCIDHILSINRTTIEIQQGNFSSWQQNKAYQDHFEQMENERLKKDIRRLQVSAGRTKNWSDKIESGKIGSHSADRGYIGHKAAKMMKRSKAAENRMEQAAEEKSALLKNIETADQLKLFPLNHHCDDLVTMRDLSLYYGERKVLGPVSFTLRQGQRLSIQGKNGSGKSSILKLMLGKSIKTTGEYSLASGLILSYVPQDTSFLRGTLKDYISSQQLDETLFKALLRKLDFSRVQFEKNMEEFSGGQKKKVLIARSLCERAHIYIWDEPLNYIDIFSRRQIEDLLLTYQPTMIFVEHDQSFVNRVATDVLYLTS
ncbi:ribosomal protection-like ABC-F family protein [Anaerolentibacter hominis]|uniref:ribosomal protection-like ABC-F family protein n=1 Tax=Anaerolentibacter hominis TaxID=3079009 RepID=UPI0031B8118F